MASCSLSASNVKLSSFCFGIGRIGIVQPRHGVNWACRRPPQHAGLKLPHRAEKALIRCCDSSAQTNSDKPSGDGSRGNFPSPAEVEYLLLEICDTSSISEFELKLDGFRLYVTRDVTSKGTPIPSPSTAPASSVTKPEAPNQNGSVSPSSAIAKSVHSSDNIRTFLDRAANDGLLIIKSPRVGVFKRSRTRKKKTFPPACVENQVVKEGRIVGFIQQMSIHTPVKTKVAGQVVRILKENDEPVGYGDPLIAILPSFPGIKKLLK